MSKTLKVIKPFFVLNVGDVLELSEDGRFYVSTYREEFNGSGVTSTDISSTYESKFNISVNYAKELIEDGFLMEATNEDTKPFVNIFDEIDTLIAKYTKDLSEVNEDTDDIPMCLRVEKTTVLNNIIKVLVHLKNLKK